MANASIAKLFNDLMHVVTAGIHAGQVRGGRQMTVTDHPAHRIQRRRLGGTARAIGDGDEIRIPFLQLGNRFPELVLHLGVLGREKLER
ncbi:hypothetical protein D3C71_2094440 [compost metagenome]